jgi:hypothetical protein
MMAMLKSRGLGKRTAATISSSQALSSTSASPLTSDSTASRRKPPRSATFWDDEHDTVMSIKVFDLSGEYAITTEDGEKLFGQLADAITRSDQIELDFTSVRVFASPFFNAAVGRLLKDRSPQDLLNLIKITNLNTVGETVLTHVIQNSEQYYRNPAARKALDSILEKENTDVGEDDPGHHS